MQLTHSKPISYRNAKPGDIIFAQWKGVNKISQINHTGVIYKVAGGRVYIAQHSPSQLTTYNYWKQKDPHLLIWIFQPVQD
jgi:cell wall-associated NlpC family hydrolase